MSKFLCSHNKKSLYVVVNHPFCLGSTDFHYLSVIILILTGLLKRAFINWTPKSWWTPKLCPLHFLEPSHSKDGTTDTMLSCTLYTHIVKGNILVFLFLRSSSVRFLSERCLLQTISSFCHFTTFSNMIQMYQSRKIESSLETCVGKNLMKNVHWIASGSSHLHYCCQTALAPKSIL